MASPQSSTGFDAAASAPHRHEQVTFRFCSECSNMLYPKEDEDAHKLQYTCRTCQYTEEAQSSCVFRNDLNTSAGETAGVTQDVGSDPTVSDMSILCLMCGGVIYCASCDEPSADVGANKVYLPQPVNIDQLMSGLSDDYDSFDEAYGESSDETWVDECMRDSDGDSTDASCAGSDHYHEEFVMKAQSMEA